MHNDTRLIEEGIKKEAKVSQENFAKTVANEVSLSVVEEVAQVVNQLDNKTSLDQIKRKLEKIKEYINKNDFSSVLDEENGILSYANSITEYVKCIEDSVKSDNGDRAIDILLRENVMIEEVVSKSDHIYTLLTRINIQDQSELIESLVDISGKNSQVISEISQNVSDINESTIGIAEIRVELKTIKSSLDEMINKSKNEHLIKEIDSIKKQMKYQFIINVIAIAGTIGIAFLLFIK